MDLQMNESTETSHLVTALCQPFLKQTTDLLHLQPNITTDTPGPVAAFPRVVVATLPGIVSQNHTLPGADCMIVDGGKILPLPESCSQILCTAWQ